jgi:hypothetical protein
VISTLVFGGIIPSTLLAVEGSARTLTWVEVNPSTGVTVGWEGGARAVSEGACVRVAGIVEVLINGGWEGVASTRVSTPQPVLNKPRAMKTTVGIRIGTLRLYRLSHKLPDSSEFLKANIELVI